MNRKDTQVLTTEVMDDYWNRAVPVVITFEVHHGSCEGCTDCRHGRDLVRRNISAMAINQDQVRRPRRGFEVRIRGRQGADGDHIVRCEEIGLRELVSIREKGFREVDVGVEAASVGEFWSWIWFSL